MQESQYQIYLCLPLIRAKDVLVRCVVIHVLALAIIHALRLALRIVQDNAAVHVEEIVLWVVAVLAE